MIQLIQVCCYVQSDSSWWFQPTCKIWVKFEIFPNFCGVNIPTKYAFETTHLKWFFTFHALGFLGHPSVETLHRLPPRFRRFTSRGAELSPHRSASESDRTKVLAPAIFPLRMLRNVKDFGFEHVGTSWIFVGFLFFSALGDLFVGMIHLLKVVGDFITMVWKSHVESHGWRCLLCFLGFHNTDGNHTKTGMEQKNILQDKKVSVKIRGLQKLAMSCLFPCVFSMFLSFPRFFLHGSITIETKPVNSCC